MTSHGFCSHGTKVGSMLAFEPRSPGAAQHLMRLMKTAERQELFFMAPHRGTVPKGWMRPVEEVKSPFQTAKDNFGNWNRFLDSLEQLFEENVYSNPNFGDLDARLHRSSLHTLIGQGEMLVVDFMMLEMADETASYISFLEGQLKRLNTVLYEWHGPVDAPSGIPEDFAIGMRQISEQKTVDLDKALNDTPS